jgi:hypothetical protein
MAPFDAVRAEAMALYQERKPAAALELWAQALTAGMDTAADAGERWECCMLLGFYEEAWRIGDRVLRLRNPADSDKAGIPAHRRFVWTGAALTGATVLIRCYHGLGDTIQFLRFAPNLAALGCRVIVQVQPALVDLAAGVAGVDCVVPLDWRTAIPAHDVAIESMEIAHALRITVADLPGAIPYVTPPPRLVAEQAARLPQTGRLRVGIAWAAGDWDPRRTVPLDALDPLAGIAGVDYVNLQRGGAEAALNRGVGPAVVNPDDRSADIMATAAAIANLDLVVTVDTMIAHLAGAMGREVWLLLHHAADWRWMATGNRSPWYPTIRIFRQPIPGAWGQPVAGIAAMLKDMGSRRTTIRPSRGRY